MSDCGCEGSCPICRVGEIENHKCDKCSALICCHCHGVINKISENLSICDCRSYQKVIELINYLKDIESHLSLIEVRYEKDPVVKHHTKCIKKLINKLK